MTVTQGNPNNNPTVGSLTIKSAPAEFDRFEKLATQVVRAGKPKKD